MLVPWRREGNACVDAGERAGQLGYNGGMTTSQEKTDALARQAIDLAKALILSDNHFLSAAVGRLEMTPVYAAEDGGEGAGSCGHHGHGHEGGPLGEATLAVDGERLYYDARGILRAFAISKEAPKHDLLHAVMHCVFLHPYVGATINQPLWNLACDMASERAVMECCGLRPGERGLRIQAVLHQVESALSCRPTAEKIYHRLCEGRWEQEVPRWSRLFFADCHDPWYLTQAEEEDDRSDSDANGNGQQGGGGAQPSGVAAEGAVTDIQKHDQRSQGDVAGDAAAIYGINARGASFRTIRSLAAASKGSDLREQQQEWRTVATSLAVNLQTFARKKGQDLSGLIDDLNQAAHQPVDFRAFLRQFATPGEVMRLSDDEFDYIFYTYGLQLYGNVPLVEPLEYREEKRIREFVLVIDTSGSVQGETVRSFVTATFDILKTTESFHRKVQVHVIQADAQVQSDDVITSADELERWSATCKIRGGGGTDFRPAFDYVNGLVEDGVFEDLGGLVYFTDGWGQYPAVMPSYRTAFVFYDEDYRPENVPSWAAQVVLDADAIDNLEKERNLHEHTGSN